MKYGGYVGIALDAGYSGSRIYNACTLGREQECRKVKFTEAGRFGGGLAGGAIGGLLDAYAAHSICVALGLSTAGVGGLACSLVVTGTAGAVAGGMGSDGGESMAERIYQKGYE
ncbi:hypothetical protein [Pseudomonas sp. RIT-PI-AD]|uniref:hypothetical protein n=1 Tax=Pseudomonas sp. RIT-PI-AD TaxID=3035294 RepID=UPI0021DB6EF9|nr:hypothetical protein [Pseudomonas sp. RIT-PI-AD]